MLLLRGEKMRDPNDYIVVGVWCVALVCVLVIIGTFQVTGQATSASFTSVNSALDFLSKDTTTLEGTGAVQCNHQQFCDGKALIQFVDTSLTSTTRTKKGSYMCVCKS